MGVLVVRVFVGYVWSSVFGVLCSCLHAWEKFPLRGEALAGFVCVCVCVRDWTGNMMNNGTDVERARFLSLPLSALRSPFHRLFPSLLHFSFYSSTFTSVHHFSFSVRSCFPFYLISLSYLALPFMFSLFSLLSFSAGWCYRLNVPLLLDIWWRNAKLKADEGKDASIVVNLFVVCPFLIRRSACCCSLYCCQSDLSNETLRKLLSVWYLCVTRDEISRKRTYIPKLCFYYLFLFPISYISLYL